MNEKQGKLAVECMALRSKLKKHDKAERERRQEAKEKRARLGTALRAAEKNYESSVVQDELPGLK